MQQDSGRTGSSASAPPTGAGGGTNGQHGATDSPFGNGGSLLGADEAAQKRIEKWAARRYPVTALDGLRYPWARVCAAQLARFNATRDPVKMPPALIFAGDKVAAKAADEQLADLGPELTSEQIAQLQLRAAAMHEDARAQVKMMARTLATERNASAQAPEPLTLTELLAQTDTDPTYRIDGLWPTGGRVLLAAQFKSGKTTLVGNGIRALVDGGRFLGRFHATPVRRVVLIDTELDTRTLRRWLRDQGIANTDAVTVIPVRGAVSTFNILDATIRAQWARLIGETDVLILDCLRPVLDALGLSEATEAGRVLTAFDELMADVRATEGMVVTHMGHQNERARGDSRLRDWCDAEWTVVRGGDEADDDASRPRFLSALGRDVSLPEGELTFDAAARHLSYEGGSRREQPARAAMPALLALVRNEPGLSKAEVERRLGADHDIPQNTTRAAIKAAIKETPPLIIVTPGEHGSHRLSVPPGSPFDDLYRDADPQPATPVLRVVTDDPPPTTPPTPGVR
jgi:hypothetical protein